jgi:hypothetical protein
MPCCHRQLYSNLLWANWSQPALNSLILLGNSFKSYEERAFLVTNKEEGVGDCVRVVVPWVRETVVSFKEEEWEVEEEVEVEGGRDVDVYTGTGTPDEGKEEGEGDEGEGEGGVGMKEKETLTETHAHAHTHTEDGKEKRRKKVYVYDKEKEKKMIRPAFVHFAVMDFPGLPSDAEEGGGGGGGKGLWAERPPEHVTEEEKLERASKKETGQVRF